ncbi:fumarylacetoacetate hydrolase family protein [uncultured Xylophilus sp.]|uniref:fumarylacetoacetate hydrolase family protein n=1 Tax=uncultured Xylophilus sp. TaxID=296832 RepID=UPI0025D9D204|nr:fumarylacetoacetate hydrolase family protein [uncultured Xylophilus sp.]
MRFVSFAGADGAPVAGVVQGDGDAAQVADLSHPSCRAVLGGTQPSLMAFVEQGLAGWVRRLGAASFAPDVLRPLAGLRLLAPVRPGKVVGAAFNFTDALAERSMAHPPEPVTFVRSGSTVIGPGESILVPPDVGDVGYEAELAVVIGRRALRVGAEDAMDHVAGYTLHNDVSGSALVKADGGNFVRGKNLPATAPLGPWLVSADALPDPYAVGIRLDIDGRRLQDGSTATMLHRIAALIAYASARMPLDPGDVIATGTPAGVAATHTPPAWLRPGQTVTVELAGLGRLTNPVQAGPAFFPESTPL